ncbi:unnamed protein product [Nippostrongylus brasiliensis]|uniref:ethanolamine kinase n=1 Tax=Nippostrongylus brasiliensis TaxID=27835 RepID=A0A158QWW8_NIPBR|nr:unnamed protein product [Nippostrongylus brasiliensis]
MSAQLVNIELSLTNRHDCEQSALELLKIIRPEWNGKSIRFEIFTAGITNKIFAAFVDDGERLVFRVFGKNTENFIDRDRELKAMERLAQNGLAAPLYAKFANGIVVGYLPGVTIHVDDMKDPRMQRRICSTMAAYHNMNGTVTPNVNDLFPFRKIRDFIGNIDTSSITDETAFVREFPKELEELQSLVVPLKEEIAFCHNDILVHNILFEKISDTVRFIDYEYADYNYALFDLANHFCEYSGVEKPDYSRCPSDDEIRSFSSMYLQERFGVIDERRVEEITTRSPLFQAVSAVIENVNGFDI